MKRRRRRKEDISCARELLPRRKRCDSVGEGPSRLGELTWQILAGYLGLLPVGCQ